MIGILIGAVIGGLTAYITGAVGMFPAISLGAASGILVGIMSGTVVWVLIPKPIRILLFLTLLFAAASWFAEKHYNISLVTELSRHFSK